jgi:hypothetical protein
LSASGAGSTRLFAAELPSSTRKQRKVEKIFTNQSVAH